MNNIKPARFLFSCILVVVLSVLIAQAVHADALVLIDTTHDETPAHRNVETQLLTEEERAQLEAALADLADRTRQLESNPNTVTVTVNATTSGECSPVIVTNDGVMTITNDSCGE